MSVIIESNYLRDIIRSELDEAGRFSRKQVTVVDGQEVSMGSVLGKVLFDTPIVGTAAVGNTGGGTVASVLAKAKTQVGTYTITCTEYTASPLAAVFEVYDPDGNRMEDAALGANLNEQLGFLIADGSPVITVGDEWTVAVAVGSGEVRAINFDGVDGTQKAYGVSIAAYDASDASVEGVAVMRDAVVIEANLIWPTTSPEVTDAEKAQAMRELAVVGIVPRDEG